MPPEITLLFILLIIGKLILKYVLYTPTPQPKPRKVRSDKGTRRVKPLPYDYARESVQQFE